MSDIEKHLKALREERRAKEREVIAALPHGVPYHPPYMNNSETEFDLREWVAEQSERNGLGMTITFKLDDLLALIETLSGEGDG